MRKSFFNCIKTSFAVVGSVVGAGFITGKEIYEFFACDFSVSGLYLAFICFFLCSYFVMNLSENLKCEKAMGVFVALSNTVITGCMIAGLNGVYKDIFCFTEKVKILSILTAILVFITTYKGIGFAEKFNLFAIPIIVVFVVALALCKIENFTSFISPKTFGGTVKPFLYVGFNVLLSSAVIKNSGKQLSPPFKILSCLIISTVLCLCIFLISKSVFSVGKNVEMPFKHLFANNGKLTIIVDIITLFAIYSTLLSSVYTSVEFGGVKLKFTSKLLVFLFSVSISFVGFSVIVEKLYPLVGIIGYAFFTVIFLSQGIFPTEKRARTFRPLKDIR